MPTNAAPQINEPTPGSTANTRDDDEGGFALPQRRVLTCREWEELRIDSNELVVGRHLQIYDDISGSKYLRAKISGDSVVFSTTHYVGHIPLNDRLALDVIPRFSISNLTRLLRLADQSPIPLERYVRSYMASHEALPSIFDDLAAAFVAAVANVVNEGLLTIYRQTERDTAFPRGRVLITPTVRKHQAYGVRHKVRASWHERTPDNAVNRLLKYTIWLLAQRFAAAAPRKGIGKIRTQLERYYRAFSSVRLDRSRMFLQSRDVLDTTRIPAVRSYYAQAVELALLLVRDNSLDLASHRGTIRAPSLLVDLQAAFERYLRNCLSAQIARRQSVLVVLDGNQGEPVGARKTLFDEPESENATPDIVVRSSSTDRERGKVSALVEVKYKEMPDRDDVNQAMGYALSYRCKRIIIAHARGRASLGGLHKIGTVGPTIFFRYAFDLAANLENEEARFATAMMELAAHSDGTVDGSVQ